MGSFPYPRNGILKIDYEFILLFKKPGISLKPTKEQKAASAMTKEEWNRYFSSHWNFNGVKQQGHLAMFPEELPKRLIKMFSFVGETVFDPFVGSGTTSLAAKNLGRNSIGYEINKDFAPIIKEKLCGNKTSSQDDAVVSFMEDEIKNKSSFACLSYVFRDPHKMDKTKDIKKLRFGSKIDNDDIKKEDLFGVKRVISPEKIELSNGLIVKLLGIKEIPRFSGNAVDFLESKLQKRKVFLRYDIIKHDDKNNMLCYVYLDNKTFINVHLLRTGYVTVDTTFEYSCKKKFLKSSLI